jgi:anti-anti-sigma factor
MAVALGSGAIVGLHLDRSEESMRQSRSVDLPEPFRCEVQPSRSAVRVVPHGELDINTVSELDARLRELTESGWTRIVLDLGELSFMDSSGVNLLMRWSKSASADAFSIELLPARESVQRVFELTGVVGSLPFADVPAAK